MENSPQVHDFHFLYFSLFAILTIIVDDPIAVKFSAHASFNS